MKALLIIGCYIIGIIISTIIFSRVFKYKTPKDGFGMPINDAKHEREHYIWISIISWIFPLSILFIILYYIISGSINFTIWINKLLNKLCTRG